MTAQLPTLADVSIEPEVDALIRRAVAIANSILQGEIEAHRGAQRLWEIHNAVVGLDDDLLAFVGLASEWEDQPEYRDDYERRIILAADRFRARWGP